MTEGNRTSGDGVSSQLAPPLTELSCITTGVSCSTVTVSAVSSVDRCQGLSSAHHAELQQLAMHATATNKYFMRKYLHGYAGLVYYAACTVGASRLDDLLIDCQHYC